MPSLLTFLLYCDIWVVMVCFFFFLERFSTLSHETRITFTVLLWLKNTKRLFSLFFFFRARGHFMLMLRLL